jgi:hypothetical protein
MAFKTFAPGVLTSSDVNTFLMRQAVIVCTSSTRPASPNEGMTIYETDTDRTSQWNGSAWVDIGALAGWRTNTPTLSGSGWVFTGTETFSSRYIRLGSLVVWRAEIFWKGGVTVGSGNLNISLPVTASSVSAATPTNVAYYFDSSLALLHQGTLRNISTTQAEFLSISLARNINTADLQGISSTYVSVGGNVTLDNNDQFYWTHIYEAA